MKLFLNLIIYVKYVGKKNRIPPPFKYLDILTTTITTKLLTTQEIKYFYINMDFRERTGLDPLIPRASK
jgi:DNA polymerase III alpha subunit (gram-positive type)